MCSADDYFIEEGVYHFDPHYLGDAHADCQRRVFDTLLKWRSCVVANTFCENWEVGPYRKIVEQTGAGLVIISLFDAGLTDEQLAVRNVHGVPVATIAAMRARFDHELTGDVRPPWERD